MSEVMAKQDTDLVTITLTRAQWEDLERQASTYLGAACVTDPALEAIRAALDAAEANGPSKARSEEGK